MDIHWMVLKMKSQCKLYARTKEERSETMIELVQFSSNLREIIFLTPPHVMDADIYSRFDTFICFLFFPFVSTNQRLYAFVNVTIIPTNPKHHIVTQEYWLSSDEMQPILSGTALIALTRWRGCSKGSGLGYPLPEHDAAFSCMLQILWTKASIRLEHLKLCKRLKWSHNRSHHFEKLP